jgi:hypothetical protein
MSEQPARISQWLTTDLVIIVVSLVLILIGVWIAP